MQLLWWRASADYADKIPLLWAAGRHVPLVAAAVRHSTALSEPTPADCTLLAAGIVCAVVWTVNRLMAFYV